MAAGLQICDLGFLDWGPLNLSVEPGEVVGISGSSGSGKSLLLRAVADLDEHSGELFLDGVACSSIAAPEWRRKVGMLAAESRWWHATVGEHLSSESLELIESLGFDAEVFEWEVARLSAGERQRLALARLLDCKPEVLLLDEPTANLDEESTRRVESVVLGSGLAALWVSHDVAQLRRVARRRLRMSNRELLEEEVVA